MVNKLYLKGEIMIISYLIRIFMKRIVSTQYSTCGLINAHYSTIILDYFRHLIFLFSNVLKSMHLPAYILACIATLRERFCPFTKIIRNDIIAVY